MKDETIKRLQKKGAQTLKDFLKKKEIPLFEFCSAVKKSNVRYWLHICIPMREVVKIIQLYNNEITLHDMRPDLFKRPK